MFSKLGPKYSKAYDEYVTKMNQLADELELKQLQDEDKSDE